MKREKRLLFIPAYNCQEQISRLIKNLNVENISNFDKILIIDNSSKDETSYYAKNAIIEKKFKNFLIIKNSKNYGLGGSHKIAFNYAIDNNYDFCCVIHGDDQGDINDLNKVIKLGKYKDFSCLRAGRFKPGSTLVGYSNFRIFGNKVFKYIYSILINKEIFDIGAGLAIFKIDDIKKINYEYFVNDMSFDSFMILVFDYYNLKFDFFNVHWKETDQISNTNLFKTAFKILNNLIRYKINKKKFINDHYSKKKESYEYETIFDN
ncbi:glycosyltransferase family 2 protein [Candidatus Pelagibacter sp.]|nr:glycosyltransferase family 2 protein [Candidatus Pelagibacter sp.]